MLATFGKTQWMKMAAAWAAAVSSAGYVLCFYFFSLGDTTPENNWTRGGYFVEVFLEGLFFFAGLRLVFIFETFLAVCCN